MKKKIIIGAIVGVLILGCVLFLLLSGKTYNVVFDTDGGTNIATQKVKSGDMAKRPSNPKKEGYEFILWELDGSEYDFTTRVKSNITLKATWKENKTKYKITFPKLPDCYIKLVRFVSDRNKCNLHIAKEMLRNGIIIEDIPAKEVKEILLLCKDLGVEPVVSPNFPHKVD